MPIPKPNKNEKKTDFIQRCVKNISGEYPVNQSIGICEQQWDTYKPVVFIKFIKKYDN